MTLQSCVEELHQWSVMDNDALAKTAVDVHETYDGAGESVRFDY